MELTNVLKNELFRPAVTLISPGLIATLPYLILLISQEPSVHDFVKNHAGVFFGMLLVLLSAVGLLMDNLGAKLESRFDEQPAATENFKEVRHPARDS